MVLSSARLLAALLALTASGGLSPTWAAQTTAVADCGPITGLPLSLEAKQRTTTPIPGTEGKLALTIEDITAGQVIASVVQKAGPSILGPRSMRSGETASFRFGGSDYQLKLDKLANVLIGDDTATFIIAQSSAATITERQKIDRLIQAVASLQGAKFIRNGQEHSAQEAAEHLRSKLQVAGDRLTTATQFIEEIASKSSLTGAPYTIRFADGRTETAEAFLVRELAKLVGSR